MWGIFCTASGLSEIEGLDLRPIPRQNLVQAVETGNATASQILAGGKEALNDLSHGLLDLTVSEPETANELLSQYRQKTGRDFWQDSGHPTWHLKALLKRGRITDATEYRMLNNFFSDVDSKVVTPKQRDKAYQMMEQFEFEVGNAD